MKLKIKKKLKVRQLFYYFLHLGKYIVFSKYQIQFLNVKKLPIMRKLIIAILTMFAFTSSAQIVDQFYGITRNNGQVLLAKVDPATGTVTNISTKTLSQFVNITGAALNPYANTYHFMGFNEIKTVDLSTGAELNSALINNPIAASYFDNFRFNNSDSTLYGLARKSKQNPSTGAIDGELYLSTINTSTGTISQISPTSIGQGYAVAGSAIDPFQKVYYYSSGSNFVGLDMYNGSIYSSKPFQINGGTYFDNFTYSCADSTIYGLIRKNYFDSVYNAALMTWSTKLDSSSIRLGKINPATGVVTAVSPYSISKSGYTLNAGSTIDPNTMTYYYNNGSELVGVNLSTGLIVSKPQLNNVNGKYFDLMRIQSNCIAATVPLRKKSISTSIKDDFKQNKLNIYPNPANDRVNISSSFKIKKVEIFNMIGAKISEQTSDANEVEISLSNINVGAYFVRCTGYNNENATQKLLKL